MSALVAIRCTNLEEPRRYRLELPAHQVLELVAGSLEGAAPGELERITAELEAGRTVTVAGWRLEPVLEAGPTPLLSHLARTLEAGR